MRSEEVDRLLANPARRRVYEAILSAPGSSFSDVARRAELYWTSVALHVAHLTRHGLVTSLRAGRRRLLFPSHEWSEASSTHAAILAEPACREVALAVARHPHVRVFELCEITRMSERAVYHHLKRLADAGLITSKRERAYRELEATPELISILGSQDADEH